MKRRQVWEIIERFDGTFTVTRGNRVVRGFATGTATLAWELVARTWQPGEKVWQVEEDGYRTDVTKQFERASR